MTARRTYSNGEKREAHRVYKRVKAGVVDTPDLSPEEFGLLYIHYPHVLPDVDREGGPT